MDDPVFNLIIEDIARHANDPITQEQIANMTYRRPLPRTFYSAHEDVLRALFGDTWVKMGQNWVARFFHEYNLPDRRQMQRRRER
jgi:hypothetical protein